MCRKEIENRPDCESCINFFLEYLSETKENFNLETFKNTLEQSESDIISCPTQEVNIEERVDVNNEIEDNYLQKNLPTLSEDSLVEKEFEENMKMIKMKEMEIENLKKRNEYLLQKIKENQKN